MKFIIKGYHGEHDEAGAVIASTDGSVQISTPGVKNGDWATYHKTNEVIVNSLNSYKELVEGINALLGGLSDQDKYPEANKLYLNNVAIPRALKALSTAGQPWRSQVPRA